MPRPSLLLPILLAALGCSPDVDRPPALPGPEGGEGTGGGGGGGGVDGGTGGAVAVIRGSLCRVVDLRTPQSCTSADLTGISIVAVGTTSTTSTTSAANGAFVLASPGGQVALLDVAASSADFKETLIRVPLRVSTAANVVIPVIPRSVFDQLVFDLQTVEPDGTGTLAVFVRSGETPVAGVNIIEPAGAFAPFFDTTAPVGFTPLGPTGPAGASLIFGVPAIGDAAFTIIAPNGQSIAANAAVQESALGISFIDLGQASQ